RDRNVTGVQTCALPISRCLSGPDPCRDGPTMKASIGLLVVLLAAGCAHRQVVSPAEMSGFLDDYSLLREGGPDEVRLVYRNPKRSEERRVGKEGRARWW